MGNRTFFNTKRHQPTKEATNRKQNHLQSGLKLSLLGVLFTNKLAFEKKKKRHLVIQIKLLGIANRTEHH